MPAVKITNKPIGIPGDDTHFLVTQPELPEGYTPTGQETEEELAELKVESVREIEMDDMVELIQDKLDMDVTPTTGSSKPVTSGGIKAALDLMDDDISSLNEDITNLDMQINGVSSGDTRDLTSSAVWTDGYSVNATNGAPYSSSSNSYADIELEGVSHISGFTRGGLETTKAIAFFNGTTFISSDYNQGGSSYEWNYSLDVPANATLVRITCTTTYKDRFTCTATLAQTNGLTGEIADIQSKIGDLADLETTDKSSLVAAINEAAHAGGGEGTGGTSDYTDLANKPQINSVTLAGNKSLSDLGIASAQIESVINGGEVETENEIPLSSFTETNFRIMTNGYWASQSNGGYVIELPDDVTTVKVKGHASRETNFALLSAFSPVSGSKAPIVGSLTTIPADETVSVTVTDEMTHLFVSRQASNGNLIAPQKVIFVSVGTQNGLVDQLSELKSGNSVEYTGSYYQLRTGNFRKGSVWRLLLTDSDTDSIEIKALTDASDTSTGETQFVISEGKEVLWSPAKDYEAIRYGANGACTLTINDCSSIYDQLERKVFYCGPSREYTKLIDAISAAERYMGSVLYVDAGTYDLVTEFGADYFAGITTEAMPGIVLKNRIYIIFSPNSRVVCHYTGDNDKVLTNFSPFNAGQYGFTIENLNLDSSRTRYAIHDERNGKDEQCVSRYINCNIKQDNSQNESWTSYCCIGGGLGANHEVVIENCTFESIAASGIVVRGAVSYHPSNNVSSTEFACELVVKDSYFITGTIEISGSRSDAQNDTTVIVTNNSFEYNSANSASGIYYSGSQSYQGTHYNIRAWNNEIRNAS